jgi:hypothetical protein
VRITGSSFKVGIFMEKFSAWGHFGPWCDFLSLDHCLVERDIE